MASQMQRKLQEISNTAKTVEINLKDAGWTYLQNVVAQLSKLSLTQEQLLRLTLQSKSNGVPADRGQRASEHEGKGMFSASYSWNSKDRPEPFQLYLMVFIWDLYHQKNPGGCGEWDRWFRRSLSQPYGTSSGQVRPLGGCWGAESVNFSAAQIRCTSWQVAVTKAAFLSWLRDCPTESSMHGKQLLWDFLWYDKVLWKGNSGGESEFITL